MVDPKKLLIMAASVNSRGGHETATQAKVLSLEEMKKHGIVRSRKERRIAKAKMRESMLTAVSK